MTDNHNGSEGVHPRSDDMTTPTPLDRLREVVARADESDTDNWLDADGREARDVFDESADRILHFLTDPAAVEELAMAVRRRQFERTGRKNQIAAMDPPTEEELDNALAALQIIASKGLGE